MTTAKPKKSKRGRHCAIAEVGVEFANDSVGYDGVAVRILVRTVEVGAERALGSTTIGCA